jgi:hypothetical protein
VRRERDDLVHLIQTFRPMGDQENRPLAGFHEDVVHQRLSGFGIEMCCRLVEDQHRSLREQSPGDRQALTLTT